MPASRTRGATTVAAAAATIVLALSACASSNEQPDGAAGTLTIALAAAPTSLDPANMEQSTSPFAQPAYDSLIRIAPDGSLEPGLATEWAFTDDENRVFEITLRDGVTFSDGSALDADALVTSLEHFDTGRSNVATLINGGTYEALDEDTVRITWDTPHPLAPTALTQQWVAGMVISGEAIDGGAESLTTSTAGAGPYVLDADETVAGSRYVYTARDDYWDPESQHWGEIVIVVMENAEQRLNALRTGEVDYALGDLTTADGAAADDMQVLWAPTIVYGLSLLDREGTLGSPLADVRVRQAINMALDRDTIAEALLGEYGAATTQTIVPSEPGFVEALQDEYPFDVEAAQALLAEAGYPDGFTLPVIGSTSSTAATLSQVIVEQLAAVGITVELDARPGPDYFEAMTSGQFAAAVIGYGSQPLPMEYDGLFGPEAIFNPLGSTSETIESEMAAALVADEEAATEHYEAIVSELVDEAWFAPAVYAPVFYFASDTIAELEVTESRPQTPITEIVPAD